MFNYHEMSSDHRLRSYIRKFWIIDNPSQATITKQALPNACITLAFVSGQGLIVDFPNNASCMTSGSYLVGELTRKVGVTVLPYTKAFMVQLNPWAASLLSKCSFHELTNQFTPILEINKTLALKFREIDILDNMEARLLIQKTLADYFYPSATSAFIAECFHLFDCHPTAIPFKLNHLSTPTRYSIRGIEKKFRQHLGLTPKHAFAIMNIRKVVNELMIPDNPISLTSLAYKYGYTDQAHFTKSYLAIMESLPSRFIKAQYILPLQT